MAVGGDKAAGETGRLGRDLAGGGDKTAGAGPDGWGRGRPGRDLAAGIQGGWGGTRRRGKGEMELEGFCKVRNDVRGAVGSGPLDSELSKRGETGPRRA